MQLRSVVFAGHIASCLLQQRLLAAYLIPGCIGRGVRLASENSSGGAGGGAGGVWAQARAQAWAQAWAQAGPKVGAQKIQKIKILKIKIRSAQNVGKVWISRKKSSRPHLGPSGPIFCVGRKNPKKSIFSVYFCYFTGFGPLLLSTRGGALVGQ